jgi:hypothetical protein
MRHANAPDFIIRSIIQRKRAGQTIAEIAEATSVPEGTVKNVCSRRHVRLRGSDRLVFKVSDELHKACDEEAHRRHMTTNALLRRMLEKIVQDKLFDAIIDDGR